jgi:hypothetical protein
MIETIVRNSIFKIINFMESLIFCCSFKNIFANIPSPHYSTNLSAIAIIAILMAKKNPLNEKIIEKRSKYPISDKPSYQRITIC